MDVGVVHGGGAFRGVVGGGVLAGGVPLAGGAAGDPQAVDRDDGADRGGVDELAVLEHVVVGEFRRRGVGQVRVAVGGRVLEDGGVGLGEVVGEDGVGAVAGGPEDRSAVVGD